MNWNSPGEFFAMGGYGSYVWGAYGVAALCLLIDPLLAWKRHREARRTARARSAEDPST